MFLTLFFNNICFPIPILWNSGISQQPRRAGQDRLPQAENLSAGEDHGQGAPCQLRCRGGRAGCAKGGSEQTLAAFLGNIWAILSWKLENLTSNYDKWMILWLIYIYHKRNINDIFFDGSGVQKYVDLSISMKVRPLRLHDPGRWTLSM